eukprot:3523776-Lingulodinium_polyedra.AAC.1
MLAKTVEMCLRYDGLTPLCHAQTNSCCTIGPLKLGFTPSPLHGPMAVDACLMFGAGINDHVRIGEELNAHARTDEELNEQREPH